MSAISRITRLFQRTPAPNGDPSGTGTRAAPADDPGEQVPAQYSSDQPLQDLSAEVDRFNRQPFAQRIADTIKVRRDPESLVLGLYGPWGSGKTTVLDFIKKELSADEGAIIVTFNPWRFSDEYTLVYQFLRALSKALTDAIPGSSSQIRTLFDTYSRFLTPLSMNLGALQIKGADMVEHLQGDADTLKKRISELLIREKKFAVILIDDIDRLDKNEIQLMFKLVKISADFPHTTYVLAFDEKMVAAALAERYGVTDLEAGRNFLEKIVQVPLHLPKADVSTLRAMCLEGVDEALRSANIELTEAEVREFVSRFSGLSSRLSTPRVAKRFGNALLFALPLLKGEVNVSDQMLIEGLRVFYPTVYECVKLNGELLTGHAPEHDRANNRSRAQAMLDKSTNGLVGEDREKVIDLLKALFPRFGGLLDGPYYNSSWDDGWASEKRVTSRLYFDGYFSYAVPPGDVPDVILDAVFGAFGSGEVDDIELIQDTLKRVPLGRYLEKARGRASSLGARQSAALAVATAVSGRLFPRPMSVWLEAPFDQAALLVSDLFENLAANDRGALAIRIVELGQPVTFAGECLAWLSTESRSRGQILSADEVEAAGSVLAQRIQEEAKADTSSLFEKFGVYTARLLGIWAKWGSSSETGAYVRSILAADARRVPMILKAFCPVTSSTNSPQPSVGDFGTNSYQSLIGMCDPLDVAAAVESAFPSVLNLDAGLDLDDLGDDKRVAAQFWRIYSSKQSPSTR